MDNDSSIPTVAVHIRGTNAQIQLDAPVSCFI